jgi:hypothetical protein
LFKYARGKTPFFKKIKIKTANHKPKTKNKNQRVLSQKKTNRKLITYQIQAV